MLYFKSRQTKVPLKHGAGSRGGSATQIELTIDQTYSAKSLNAQAGKAVAEAIDQTNTKLMSRMGGVLHFRGTTSLKGLDYLEPQIGDVYNIDQPGDSRHGSNYVWTGKEWDKLSQSLDHLAAHTDFKEVESTINTHKNNQDGNAMHLDAAGYTKFSQIEIFDSSEINDFLDNIIEEYIADGRLVTTNSFKQTVNEVIQRIEETIIQSVTGDVASNFLTKGALDAYRTEVQSKLVGHLKSAEVDEIKFYKKTDSIPSLDSRTAKVLYLVEEDGISRSVEGGQMVLTVNTTANNSTVNFGPILGKWDGAANAIATSGLLDWGDGSAIVQLTNNMGETNSLLSHTYATSGEHKITLSGKLKWNGTRVNQNGGASPTDTTLCSLLTKIEIPSGETSPIYRARAHCFHNCKHITTVPAGLFDNAGETTSFEQLFDSCAALTSIPEHLFDHCINVTNFTNAFLKTAISNIPADLFKNCTNVTTFHACFNNCKHLTTIPKDLFAYCIKVTFFDYCFAGCSNITQIPADLFVANTKAVSFNHTFANCTSLTSIPSSLFANNNTASHFMECFNNCTAVIGELPDLWNSHPNAISQSSKCFNNCSGADNYIVAQYKGFAEGDVDATEFNIETTSNNYEVGLGYHIGIAQEHLGGSYILWGDGSADTKFDQTSNDITNTKFNHRYTSSGNYTITLIGQISYGYYYDVGNNPHDWKDLPNNDINNVLKTITIPTGHNSALYNIGNYAFAYSTKLTTIPENLFNPDLNHTIAYLYGLFWHCESLTAIPVNLFQVDSCMRAGVGGLIFANCYALTSIPNGLFTRTDTMGDCIGIYNMDYGFANCTNLQTIPSKLFADLSNCETYESCFENCTALKAIPSDIFDPDLRSYLTLNKLFNNCINVSGELPDLWNSFSTSPHNSCFCNCRKATNYNDAIEAGWACPDDVVIEGGEMKLIVNGYLTTGVSIDPSRNYAYIVKAGDVLGNSYGNWPAVATGGTLDWGDGSDIISFDRNDQNNDPKFIHYYKDDNEYTITIKGKIRWVSYNEIDNVSNPVPTWEDLRYCIRNIIIPDGKTSPIYDIGYYAFTCIYWDGAIPENLLENCTETTNFDNCFWMATFSSIPSKLFSKCTKAINFNYCFYNCAFFPTIPDDLFASCPDIEFLDYCFAECLSLNAIPENLFAHNLKIKGLTGCFAGGNVIKTIPENLFVNCHNVEWMEQFFYDCPHLLSIPPKLFNGLTTAWNFTSAFGKCTSLSSIPETLFSTCPVHNIEACFYRCTGITTDLPQLWNTLHTDPLYYDQCFCGCVNAPNYQEAVNAGWACVNDVPTGGGGVME